MGLSREMNMPFLRMRSPELTKTRNPQGLEENQKTAKAGGTIAGNARKEIEKQTGKPVITSQNAKTLNDIVTGLLEENMADDAL